MLRELLYHTLIGLVAFAPVVSRPAPDRIEVTGASYAYTVPESAIARGSEILHGIAWGNGEPIAFAIDPMAAYKVYTFEQGDDTSDDHASSTIAPDRQAVIDHAAAQLVYWNRQIEMLGDGTHPSVAEPVDYFEIRDAMIRAHARMEQHRAQD